MTDILIIAHDRDLAGLLRHIFQLAGCSVSILQDRDSIWRVLQTAQPSLIIMDMTRSDSYRLDLLGDIRARSRTPIIVLGSREDHESRATVLEMGADDYLGLPFRLITLKARALDLISRWNDKDRVLDNRIEPPLQHKI